MIKCVTLFVLIAIMSALSVARSGQDFAQIKHYAQLANDAYLPPNALKPALEKQGESLSHQAIIPSSLVNYFLTLSGDHQIIAIRGTDNVENAMVDIDLELQADEQLSIRLHQGFAGAANAVFEDVTSHLAKDKPIDITGHSLGGAIAVILAMYLDNAGYSVAHVVTFGQPKVTNVTGANQFEDLPLTRVVTADDIVPLVPPMSPLQIKDMDIYWHMGEEIILMGNNTYAQTRGLKSMLRATKVFSVVPSQKNLVAHQMETYLGQIDALKESAELIPYKTELSLFGFSLDEG
jgi:hypothetical protein